MSNPRGWVLKHKRLTRIFTFDNFASAISFMVEIALYCEKNDHHPEWKNIYNKIYVELISHDKNDVTNRDRKLALYMNKVFAKE